MLSRLYEAVRQHVVAEPPTPAPEASPPPRPAAAAPLLWHHNQTKFRQSEAPTCGSWRTWTPPTNSVHNQHSSAAA